MCMMALVAAGCRVRMVTRSALACTFISIFARQPMLILSPLGAVAPVRRDAAPYMMNSDSSGTLDLENFRVYSRVQYSTHTYTLQYTYSTQCLPQ